VRAHATFQAIVETQVAMGNKTPTKAAVKRLMLQGADRHEALHAVASVLATYLWEGMQTDIHESGTAMNSAYEEQVRNLTLQKYYDEYG